MVYTYNTQYMDSSEGMAILLEEKFSHKKGLPIAAVILIALLTAAIGGGGVYIWQKAGAKNIENNNIALNKALEESKNENNLLKEQISGLEKELSDLKEAAQKAEKGKILRETVQSRADGILYAMRDTNMERLAEYVHPDKGVSFTPYSYIEENNNITIKAGDLAKSMSGGTKLVWGAYDGTGEPISLTFKEYFNKFVYDHDFLEAPQIVFNEVVLRGNSLHNVREVHPDSVFIEYYFSGFDAQYNGMDWESLMLVFERKDGTWYLVRIIHNQWTI